MKGIHLLGPEGYINKTGTGCKTHCLESNLFRWLTDFATKICQPPDSMQ